MAKRVKNRTAISVRGVGILGEGPYKASRGGVHTKEYLLWTNMLQRAYNKELQAREPSYVGTTICKRWHTFQNFASDVNSMPNFDKEGYQLDKDLIKPGNKHYAPNLCSFVPKHINLLLNNNRRRTTNLPIGVSKAKWGYAAEMSITIDGVVHRTRRKFATVPEAAAFYNKHKSAVVRKMAKKYKKTLHPVVYNYLANY